MRLYINQITKNDFYVKKGLILGKKETSHVRKPPDFPSLR